MIRLNQIVRAYPAKAEGGGEIRALDGISLQVAAGEWLAVMGPSGSGKSTLVNLIGCLDQPTVGEVWLDGQNVAGIAAKELARVRAEKIGFIFQHFHMIPYLTAVENVMLAQYFHSMTDEDEALEALQRVGLKDRAQHLPAQLSGGEQQRVCIARALINDPKIVLADEPTGNLDAANQEIVMRLFPELRTIHNPCHEELTSIGYSTAEGSYVVEMTARGRQRASDVIRRHRLTERLFTDSLHMENESEIAEQACKLEHILSQEATDRICAFLGHPTTCPHGAPIPPGPCCGARFLEQKQQLVIPTREEQASPRG